MTGDGFAVFFFGGWQSQWSQFGFFPPRFARSLFMAFQFEYQICNGRMRLTKLPVVVGLSSFAMMSRNALM